MHNKQFITFVNRENGQCLTAEIKLSSDVDSNYSKNTLISKIQESIIFPTVLIGSSKTESRIKTLLFLIHLFDYQGSLPDLKKVIDTCKEYLNGIADDNPELFLKCLGCDYNEIRNYRPFTHLKEL